MRASPQSRSVVGAVTLVLGLGVLASPAAADNPKGVQACLDVGSAKIKALGDTRTAVAQAVMQLPVADRATSPLNGWLVQTAFEGPKIGEEINACVAAAHASPPDRLFDPSGYYAALPPPPPGFLLDFHPVQDTWDVLIGDDIETLTSASSSDFDKLEVILGWFPPAKLIKVRKALKATKLVQKLRAPLVKALREVPPEVRKVGRKAIVEALDSDSGLNTGLKVTCRILGDAATTGSAGACGTLFPTGQAAQPAAAKLGYRPTESFPFDSHGQPVFRMGNTFITPDLGKNSGGAWVMYKKGQGKPVGAYTLDLEPLSQ